MGDEIKEVVENVEDVAESETVTEQGKTDKSFSQEQVNKIVNERLSRERKTQKQLTDTWESEKETFTTKIEKLESILSTSLDEMKKFVSADVLELLADRDILDQYEWLQKHSKKENKKNIEPTPKQVVATNETPKGKFQKVF